MINYSAKNGFPQNELRSALENHPGFKHGSNWVPALKILQDGDAIDVGDYHLVCVHTPGHTLGHTCLYEPEKKLLVSGDHILIDITPNIQCLAEGRNPLKQYLASLEKIRPYDVDLVLPGHRRLFSGFRERIQELLSHHHERLDEVLAILEDGPQTGYDVAARMSWDIVASDWDHFPVAQQWFATGEALAHLRYLEVDGHLGRENDRGTVRFFR